MTLFSRPVPNGARLRINPKHEIRNPKQIQITKILNDQNKNDNSKHFGAFVLNFEYLNFDIVSDFDIRISDLLALS